MKTMVRPLKYYSGLSFEEAVDMYQEVSRTFASVKGSYASLIGRFRRNMAEKDRRELADCISVLLPLGLEASVQKQFRAASNPEETLHQRIGDMLYQIMAYMANFRNTDVTHAGFARRYLSKEPQNFTDLRPVKF